MIRRFDPDWFDPDELDSAFLTPGEWDEVHEISRSAQEINSAILKKREHVEALKNTKYWQKAMVSYLELYQELRRLEEFSAYCENKFLRIYEKDVKIRSYLTAITAISFAAGRCGGLLEAADELAKRNAEVNAQKVDATRKGGGKGGRRRAENLARIIAKEREPRAMELAKKFRDENPYLQTSKLVSEISDFWGPEEVPPDSWIVGFVRRAEKDGRLPRRLTKTGVKGVQ